MTYQPSQKAVEATAREFVQSGGPYPPELLRNAERALRAALPMELERERKRWEREVKRQAESIAEAVYESWFDGRSWYHASERNRRDILNGIEEGFNTIFGPEEEERWVDEGLSHPPLQNVQTVRISAPEEEGGEERSGFQCAGCPRDYEAEGHETLPIDWSSNGSAIRCPDCAPETSQERTPDAPCMCDHAYEDHRQEGKNCEAESCECPYFEPLPRLPRGRTQ